MQRAFTMTKRDVCAYFVDSPIYQNDGVFPAVQVRFGRFALFVRLPAV